MPEPESYELITLIKRLAALLHQNIDMWLKPYDLARTQYVILHNLRSTGSLPTSVLMERLQVEPGTLSGLLDTLETKGLVQRVEQAADKRRKDIQLTAAGRKLLAEIPPPGPVMERAMLRGIGAHDVLRVRETAELMLENLEDTLRKQERGAHAE